METLIQITGVQYTCAEADLRSVMTGMQQQKPEVLLVTEQTHDFGIIVRALVGTEYRGVVSRFDLKSVLRMMQYGNTSVIVGKVAAITSGFARTILPTMTLPTPCPTSGPTGTGRVRRSWTTALRTAGSTSA